MGIQGLGLDVGVNTCVDSSRYPRRPTRAYMFSGGHEASCLLLMFRLSESDQMVVRQLVTIDSCLDMFIFLVCLVEISADSNYKQPNPPRINIRTVRHMTLNVSRISLIKLQGNPDLSFHSISTCYLISTARASEVFGVLVELWK